MKGTTSVVPFCSFVGNGGAIDGVCSRRKDGGKMELLVSHWRKGKPSQTPKFSVVPRRGTTPSSKPSSLFLGCVSAKGEVKRKSYVLGSLANGIGARGTTPPPRTSVPPLAQGRRRKGKVCRQEFVGLSEVFASLFSKSDRV